MFGWRKRTDNNLEFLRLVTWDVLRESRSQTKQLRIIMSNQELFDAYAARIHEQNGQIKAAVVSILQEVGKLQIAAVAATEKPLDTSKMEEALAQLTAAVDEVEAIPTPVAEEPAVEPVAEEVVAVEETVEEVVEVADEVAVEEVEEEVVEDATIVAADEDEDSEEE